MTGSHNAGKFFMTFSDGGDTAPTIEPFELSQASEQFQFLSEESTNKIMIGHRVTSPALFGVKTAGQLGGTDELKTASQLFHSNVISSYQDMIIDSVKTLLSESGIYNNITIDNANPMLPKEGADLEQSFTGIQISSAVDIITKVKLGELNSKQAVQLLISMLGLDEEVARTLFDETALSSEKKKDVLTDLDKELWLQYLEEVGEVVGDEWEEISDEPVTDAENEHLIHANEVKFFKRFADPEEKSQVDSGLYKIRYRYNGKADEKSRDFCTRMVANAQQKVVYRYEDIIEMGNAGINGDFAPEGKSNYSIWLYKGGVYCRHYWSRVVYFRKREGGKVLPNRGLANDKRVSEGTTDREGVQNQSTQGETARTRSKDITNRGERKDRKWQKD